MTLVKGPLCFVGAVLVLVSSVVSGADSNATPERPGGALGEAVTAEGTLSSASVAALGDFSPERLRKTLDNLRPDAPSLRRGAKEEQVYSRVSPAVVLVATKESIGSGTILNADGLILTNYHVVAGYQTVGVALKPKGSTQLTRADILTARVIKTDANVDLALLKLVTPPPNLPTLPLGALGDISVGSDVHAIGHPTGEMWTYTKGLVSQIRPNYEWKVSDSELPHHATVIQTQTPINPGNSGGPLISDAAKLVGVNTFRSQGEGLNFAVAVDEVAAFLARPASATTPAKRVAPTCEARSSKRVPDKAWKGFVTRYDTNCDDKVDALMVEPFDESEPIVLYMDTKYRGQWDVAVFDIDRDGKWDRSVWMNDDGTCRIIGIHETGELEPTRWERCPKK